MALISLGGRLMSSTNWPSCASAVLRLRSLMDIVNDCSCSDLICGRSGLVVSNFYARAESGAGARL